MSGHLPSHLAFSAVIISSCSSVARVPSSRLGPELKPGWLRAQLYGSDGDPIPRGVVGFVFLQASLCHFTYQHVKGHPSLTSLTLCRDPRRVERKQSPCRLIGMRGRTIRRGIHGSTSEHHNGLCAVVPVSHAYLGATASDTGS